MVFYVTAEDDQSLFSFIFLDLSRVEANHQQKAHGFLGSEELILAQ